MHNAVRTMTTMEIEKILKDYVSDISPSRSLPFRGLCVQVHESNMAREVVRDILIERKRDVVKQVEPVYNFALVRIGIGIVIALITYIITDNLIFPVGIIAGGVVAALLAKKKIEE